MDLSTLWRMPVTLKRVTVDNAPYIYMEIDLTPEETVHKLMKMTPKFCTSIKHYDGRGLKKGSKLSNIRMQVYSLLVCHTSIKITPIELEQDTESVNILGEPEGCWTTYTYLILMLQRFLTEVVNEHQTV